MFKRNLKKIVSLILVSCLVLSSSITASKAAIDYSEFSLSKALMNPEFLPKLKHYDYSKEYFKLFFATPVSGYRYAVENKDRTVYHKHKRRKHSPYSLTEEDLSEITFWSYKEPKVSVFIVPQPQTKNTVKLGRLIGFTAAATFTVITFGIGMATLGLPGKIEGYKVSKDFKDMQIINAKTKEIICMNNSENLLLMNDIAQQYFFNDDHYTYFVNKLYLGIHDFSPECFNSDEKLKLQVFDKKGKRVLSFTIPKKLKRAINTDFSLGMEDQLQIN